MKTLRPTLSILSGIALATSGMVLCAAPPASADLSWNWSYKCSFFTTQTKCKGGSGTFTTTDQQGSGGDQYYVVNGITGTVEGNTITSLLAPDSLGFDNDNKLSPAGNGVTPYLNIGFSGPSHKITGIAFLTNNDPPTGANVNQLFSNFIDDEVGYYTQIGGPNKLALENIDFSSKQVGVVGLPPAAVPEPSSLLGYITLGGLMLGSTLRKAFK